MNPAITAGTILLGVGIVIFLLEGFADLRGYGQMIAWFRMTLLLVGIAAVIWGITQNKQAEQDAADQLPARAESNAP